MPRQSKYVDNAERQAAYRERKRADLSQLADIDMMQFCRLVGVSLDSIRGWRSMTAYQLALEVIYLRESLDRNVTRNVTGGN